MRLGPNLVLIGDDIARRMPPAVELPESVAARPVLFLDRVEHYRELGGKNRAGRKF